MIYVYRNFDIDICCLSNGFASYNSLSRLHFCLRSVLFWDPWFGRRTTWCLDILIKKETILYFCRRTRRTRIPWILIAWFRIVPQHATSINRDASPNLREFQRNVADVPGHGSIPKKWDGKEIRFSRFRDRPVIEGEGTELPLPF
jgi:hypothetical protein